MNDHDNLIAGLALGEQTDDERNAAEQLVANNAEARAQFEILKATMTGLHDWQQSHAQPVRRSRAPIGMTQWISKAAVILIVLGGAWAVIRPDLNDFEDHTNIVAANSLEARLTWTKDMYIKISGESGGVVDIGGSTFGGPKGGEIEGGDPGGAGVGDGGTNLGGNPPGSSGQGSGIVGGSKPGSTGQAGGMDGGLHRTGARRGSPTSAPDLSWFTKQFDFGFVLPYKIAGDYEFEGGKPGPDSDPLKVALKYTQKRSEILVFLMPEKGADEAVSDIKMGSRTLQTVRRQGLRIAIFASDLQKEDLRALFGKFVPNTK